MFREMLLGGFVLAGSLACASPAITSESTDNLAHAERLYEAASQAVYLEDQIALEDAAQQWVDTPEGEGWDGAELSGRPYDGLTAVRQWVDSDGYAQTETTCGAASWIRYQVKTDDDSVVWADAQYHYKGEPNPGMPRLIGMYATNPEPLIREEGPLGRLLVANCAWSNIPWPRHERVTER